MQQPNGQPVPDLTPTLAPIRCKAAASYVEDRNAPGYGEVASECGATLFLPLQVVQLRPIARELGQLQQAPMLAWRCAKCGTLLDAVAADREARGAAGPRRAL